MSLRFIALLIMTFLAITFSGNHCVYSDNTMAMNSCQEILNNARSYESRATWHNQVAKALMQQIQNLSSMPKNSGTMQAIENLFQQYDQNRQMETQMRQLFRQYSEQAQQCMKSLNWWILFEAVSVSALNIWRFEAQWLNLELVTEPVAPCLFLPLFPTL